MRRGNITKTFLKKYKINKRYTKLKTSKLYGYFYGYKTEMKTQIFKMLKNE